MFQAATETKARIGAKFGQSLVITLKNVPHASLPQGLIPVSRLDHNLRKSVPSARSKDKTRFTSISPVKCLFQKYSANSLLFNDGKESQ